MSSYELLSAPWVLKQITIYNLVEFLTKTLLNKSNNYFVNCSKIVACFLEEF